MPITSDPNWDYLRSSINQASEADSFVRYGTGQKVFGLQIPTRRHIVAEAIQTQAANKRLVLQTTKNQAFELDITVCYSPFNWLVEIRPATTTSVYAADLIYVGEFTVSQASKIYVPRDCLVYIQANSLITRAFITATPYYTEQIEIAK